MFPIDQFSIKTVSETATEGVFHIGPLPKGFASTIGNTYRRLLLSSIPGAAVSAIKLGGAQHEYTTLSGLQDDVLSVVLAVKGLALISHTNDPVSLTLKVKGDKKGPRVVTAGDIEKNAMIEIIDPEYPITTLADDKAEIDAVIVVSKGLGYHMPDDAVRQEVGMIPVDANFTPVRLVSMNVTNARVGQDTDLDQLELKIVTSGAITPSAALFHAAESMVKMSEHLKDSAKDLLSAKSQKQVEEAELPLSSADVAGKSADKAPIIVENMTLPTRLANALLNGGYHDLRQLEGLTEEEVAGIKGMGETSYGQLLDILRDNGIKLI